MNINPESKPISEIFPIEGKTTYNIPIYQRNYSWNNDNIEELFNDVMNEEAGYYIGNLLVTRNSSAHEFDVVDGQQRLTTIALFFLAIFEELTIIKDNYSSDTLEFGKIFSLQADISRKLRINDDQPKLKLLEPDYEIFKSYLQVLDGKSKGRFGNRTFGKRYKFIQRLVSDKELDETSDDFVRLNEFYNKLNNVELLRITVNDLTDAFSVFTSLNAKGLPLTLIDLLKSYYLSEAVHKFSESEALDEWHKLMNVFSNEVNESNSTAITQFLQNNYDAFEGEGTSSITKRASLRKYEKLFQDNGYQYMDKLIINAKLFSTIIPQVKSNEEIKHGVELQNLLDKLYQLEASPVYPLMLYLLKEKHQKNIEESTVESIFIFLIKYYVRRNVTLKPKSSNIRSKAIQVVRLLQCEKELNDNALSITKKILIQIMSSDAEFLSALKGSIYDITPRTVRFLLIELESKKGYFNKQNYTLDKYNNGKPLWTLEHILPQNENLKNNWKEMISPENIDLASNLQKENVHKLGNLTLTGYNSEMSDKSFIEKRDYKPKDSNEYTGLRTNLFLNESIVGNEERIDNKNTWTIEDIELRTNKLAKLIFDEYFISGN